MYDTSMISAAAPIAGVVILLTFLPGRGRVRDSWPWWGAAVVFLFGSTISTQCSARASGLAQIDARLFPSDGGAIAVFDQRTQEYVLVGGEGGDAKGGVRLLSGAASGLDAGRPPGRAAMSAERAFNLRLRGSEDDVRRLQEALELLATTRVGQAVLGDVLTRSDIVVTLSDNVGVELPTGHVISTGGTAVTEGNQVTISRQSYGHKGPKVLAAMVAHELTHVAQNLASRTAWWQWPWTTIEREETAHIVQALVWAETRGLDRDAEQDRNLQNTTSRDRLRWSIQANPAYPPWLAPDLHC